MTKTGIAIIVVMLCISHVVAFTIGAIVLPRYREIEIYHEMMAVRPEDPWDFYIAILKEEGYNITKKELSVNEYEALSFEEFLWLLEVAEVSECYYDDGSWEGTFPFIRRTEKLWIQIDGIYWEVRE